MLCTAAIKTKSKSPGYSSRTAEKKNESIKLRPRYYYHELISIKTGKGFCEFITCGTFIKNV